MGSVGAGVPDSPTAKRQFGTMRENLPIEVKFPRRVVEDADPYEFENFDMRKKESAAAYSGLFFYYSSKVKKSAKRSLKMAKTAFRTVSSSTVR